MAKPSDGIRIKRLRRSRLTAPLARDRRCGPFSLAAKLPRHEINVTHHAGVVHLSTLTRGEILRGVRSVPPKDRARTGSGRACLSHTPSKAALKRQRG